MAADTLREAVVTLSCRHSTKPYPLATISSTYTTMTKTIKALTIVVIAIAICFALLYYAFLHIDFVGHKDPKIVEENVRRWNNTLLSAEYRQGTDYCKVDLVDSTKMEINVGDKTGGTFVTANYKISGDTIINLDGIKHVTQYLNSDRFIIDTNKIFYKLDDTGVFDTSTAMTIRFNKLKL